MRRDEKSLLKRLAHLEEKLASLGEPQNATQKRLKALWGHKLNRTKAYALRDGKEARFWVDYELVCDLLVEEILKGEVKVGKESKDPVV